ncbi:uncharacterized protein [Montipora foliosa]|uniref:uncharacterized protein n=1 Tax=Montipora foliosa TaxID=591990 RepID=UPI0035F1A1B5
MAAFLAKSLYVDDLLSGAGDDEKALEIYHKSKGIMAGGGFSLRKWNSNSPNVMSEISKSEGPQEDSITKRKSQSDVTIEDDQSYTKTTTGLDSPSTKDDFVVKVLGLNWNTLSDELFFDFSSLHAYAKSLPLSKRSVLKVTTKIFDPMGFLTPFTIGLKILFQELCIDKINWDETLQGKLLEKWTSLLDEIRCFETVRIPRCYFTATPVEIQMHAFSDTSEHAYAAVFFLRSRYDDGRIDVRLAASKSKVSTMTKKSIPRLELLGALSLLARLVDKFKAVKSFKGQVNDKNTEKERVRLNAADLKEAEHLWIRSVQGSAFSKEIVFLLSKDHSSAPPAYVTQFGFFLDDGIIKCKGRLKNAPLPVNTRNPILLPAKHEFTCLLIKQSHESVKHSGITDTLTTLRERYWILRGREAVKKFIRICVICRKHEGTPYGPLPPPDLPSNRVSEDPPFSHIGLDFAGPLYVEVKNSEYEIKESQRVYVCLFTCASTRAVHVELTRTLSVESFLLAFRRFTSRRGLPATITSDNAKTFRSSSQDIRKIARAEEVWRYLANKQISWSFIIEKAPWWGGFWERLVRSIKKPLKKILGRSTLSFDELSTVLVEIEGIINSRPLTYVYDDKEAISFPLTPSDLIYGRRITSTPNATHYEVVSTNQSLTKKSRHHRHVLQQLTNQWRREYLIELKERSQVGSKGCNKRRISIGDLVLLKNDSTSRAFWKLAKVEELIPGRAGNVRAAVVKVANNSGRPSHLRRVVQHLLPIEIKVHSEATATNETQPMNQVTRPRRVAAVNGETLRRELNIV